MARRDRYSQRSMGQTYVVLLVGVLMSLLMFLLLVATFGRVCWYNKVDTPYAVSGQRLPEHGFLVVNVVPWFGEDVRSKVLIRGQVVKTEEVAGVIRAAREESPNTWVLVRADKRLTYQDVSPVLTACASEDNGTMHLATECW